MCPSDKAQIMFFRIPPCRYSGSILCGTNKRTNEQSYLSTWFDAHKNTIWAAARRRRWPFLSHIGKNFSSFFSSVIPRPTLESQIPATFSFFSLCPIVHPIRGSNLNLQVQISVLRLTSHLLQRHGSNPNLKAQIPPSRLLAQSLAFKLKSQPLGTNHSHEA